MAIGKISINELNQPLREYLENLDPNKLTIETMSITTNNESLSLIDENVNNTVYSRYTCETGTSINEITVNWSLNKTDNIVAATLVVITSGVWVQSVKIDNEVLDGTYTVNTVTDGSKLNLTKNSTVRLYIKYKSNNVDTVINKDIQIYFKDPIFYGKCDINTCNFVGLKTESETYLDYYVNNSYLTKRFEIVKDISFITNTKENEYIYFIVPKNLVASATDTSYNQRQQNMFFINGVNGGLFFLTYFYYTRKDGTSTTYYVYRSTNPCLGRCEVVVKTPPEITN